jgi:TonB family protein
MRRVVPVVLFAACGGSAPPPAKPVEPAKPHRTRMPIEDNEPETEDGVTFVTKHGHMEQAAIQAGLAPHTTELSECYTSRVGRRRWLGGHVQIHWDINAEGTVTSVKLAESDLGAWAVERCLVEVARSATFDKPIGGPADFAIPLDFSGKGNTHALDEDEGLKAVGGQLANLEACSKTEPAPDDVIVTVYVGAHGKAQSVGFASAKTEITDKWAECAEKAAMAWRLPDPHGMVAKLAIRYRPQ